MISSEDRAHSILLNVENEIRWVFALCFLRASQEAASSHLLFHSSRQSRGSQQETPKVKAVIYLASDTSPGVRLGGAQVVGLFLVKCFLPGRQFRKHRECVLGRGLLLMLAAHLCP